MFEKILLIVFMTACICYMVTTNLQINNLEKRIIVAETILGIPQCHKN